MNDLVRKAVALASLLSLSAPPLGAAETSDEHNYCNDNATTQRWQSAVATNPKDRSVLQLYAMRRGLCDMLKEGTISADTARSMWDQAVIGALVEKGRESIGDPSLILLFGTF